MPKGNQKISSLGKYQGYNLANYNQSNYLSQYVEVKDGTKLAVDCYVPKSAERNEKFPTVVYFMRYTRQFKLKFPFSLIKSLGFGTVKKKEIDFLTNKGYACVLVDLRGSGASFGYRKMEFSNDEVNDMYDVLDWIVAQSWSDGKTATTGVSYTGTTAEFALSTNHPSLKAAIPRFAIFDLYSDMNFPGGMRLAPFIDAWQKSIHALDNYDYSVFHALGNAVIEGAKPVQEDKKRTLRNTAILDHHKNFDVFKGIHLIDSRDEKVEELEGLCNDDFSIHTRVKNIENSGVPIYRITGWYDAALVYSAIKGYWNTSNTHKVLIGPWDHGPQENISPFIKNNKLKFHVLTEVLRFLDFHLKDIKNNLDSEPRFGYYNMGKEVYIQQEEWLMEQVEEIYFLNSDQTLSKNSVDENSTITYECDYHLTTGKGTRWRGLTPIYRDGKIIYRNREEQNQRMVLFKTESFKSGLNITGHPSIDLTISCDSTDAQVFVYLEDVAPDGKVTYITEGWFRAVHRKEEDPLKRPYKDIGVYHTFKQEDKEDLVPNQPTKLTFNLLPISYSLPQGHTLQLSIGTSDIDHFDNIKTLPKEITFYLGSAHQTKLYLPKSE